MIAYELVVEAGIGAAATVTAGAASALTAARLALIATKLRKLGRAGEKLADLCQPNGHLAKKLEQLFSQVKKGGKVEGGDAPVKAALPRTLQQQRELAHLTTKARSELVDNFDELARELSPAQMRAIADEPWRMQVFFGTALESRVAAKVRDVVRANPDSVLSDLRWTGRTNAPQDFIGPGGHGFDITGNSISSIRSHYARKQVQAVVTYDSIPSDLGRRFVRWMSE
jgi:hypothetical protein